VKNAYSSAHLRAMAQCYHARAFDQAKHHLSEAARLDPRLVENNGQLLAARLAALADSPKIQTPLRFWK
jgi:hypothetical protein